MSVRVTTDVFCDGCGRWAHYRVSSSAHIREAQRAAKALGWSFDRKGDCQCPECNGKDANFWPFNYDGTSAPILPPVKSRGAGDGSGHA